MWISVLLNSRFLQSLNLNLNDLKDWIIPNDSYEKGNLGGEETNIDKFEIFSITL